MEALAASATTTDDGLGVVQVAALTGLDKSVVSRTLAALAHGGYVERDPDTRRYRLGWRLFAMSARAGDQRLVAAARAVMPRLVTTLGETAHLSVLRGAEVLTLVTEQASHAVATVGWIGRIIPAYCTSSGRALLLDHSRTQLADRLSGVAFEPRGPRTAPDLDTLHERIVAARPADVVVVDEESEPGLLAIGAPVRDAAGRIAAALNVSGPRFRLRRGLAAATRQVGAAAREISAEFDRRPVQGPTQAGAEAVKSSAGLAGAAQLPGGGNAS